MMSDRSFSLLDDSFTLHPFLKWRWMIRAAARTERAAWGVPEGPELTRGIALPSQISKFSISWDSK